MLRSISSLPSTSQIRSPSARCTTSGSGIAWARMLLLTPPAMTSLMEASCSAFVVPVYTCAVACCMSD